MPAVPEAGFAAFFGSAGECGVSENRDPFDQRREILRASGQFMGHGMTWALAVLLFMGIGWWVDSKLGTGPILMILGAFVGGAAGFYSLYYHIVIEPKEQSDDSE
jgi:F0F1-type ATP synthase assembly protein I